LRLKLAIEAGHNRPIVPAEHDDTRIDYQVDPVAR
jgi:hypothetical protein